MRQFVVLAPLVGGIAAFLGFWLAYQWDLPVGPTDVVLLGLFYATAWVVSHCQRVFRTAGVDQIEKNSYA
jgi:ABC-type Mn2+/Zn2+ transport system permease subunit